MEREAQDFDDFEDAERADAEYYAGLTPKERVDLLLVWSKITGGLLVFLRAP